jgi:polyribonucleotide nucleotidyltransferase
MTYRQEVELGGKVLTVETGTHARQAHGSVMARFGDTMVLATAVAKDEPVEQKDFFPLSVEYREKTSAAGKIPGGFIKREGRPSEKEILSARLIDRPIRPLFPKDFRCETQVIVTVYSSDQENDADVIGAVAASAALTISDIPFDGPIAEVRIGRIDGEFIVNPTHHELETSDMDVVVAGTEDSIVMVEGEAKEISEPDLLQAIKHAHDVIRKLVQMQRLLATDCGKPKRGVVPSVVDENLLTDVKAVCNDKVRQVVETAMTKAERSEAMAKIREEVLRAFTEKYVGLESTILGIVHDAEGAHMREMVLGSQKRMDGRGLKDIRPITCEISVLPRTHGSSLFTRGETQSLTTLTLGTKMDEQLVEGLQPETSKRFMLHYNFPPFCVGEVARLGVPGRREVGHGNLAERSLKNMIPPEGEFPYTVRLVSDILESNGSSSMASVCAGTLALMDGGVPMNKPVAGIAMGLVKEGDRVAILTDILGAEDHLGDMDFKIAGTRDGITAFQMDIKIGGISYETMSTALEQAREGRIEILEIMGKTISQPRSEISKYAPQLSSINIPVDMIGAVIGPGGKTIRHIVQESGAEINIEDDGRVVIAAVSKEASDKAMEMIGRIVEVPEVGKIYKGKVRRIESYGAFVELLPNFVGLLHISQIEHRRIAKVEDVLKLGDEVEVKLLEKDEDGKFKLSRKVLLEKPAQDESHSGDSADHSRGHVDHGSGSRSDGRDRRKPPRR